MSRVPGVAFFIPETWYNIVALIDPDGIRYYCNIASPPYDGQGVITYIDYDLDVIVHSGGDVRIVDRDEYDTIAKAIDTTVWYRNTLREACATCCSELTADALRLMTDKC